MTVAVVDTDHMDRLKQQMNRIEHKLDALIAALADEEDPPVRSLDNGRTFAARDDKRGLG
jgi:hypothetical protein